MELTKRLRYFLFNRIFERMEDAVIIMRETREIIEMNPAARTLTGWNVGEHVPYCLYCQRERYGQEQPCYLIHKKEVPYFLSEMPTYVNGNIPVEMSTALIFTDEVTNENLYLLLLRDQTMKRQEEEAKMAKQMIKALIEAKESEHRRLSKELHDGVGQSLYSVSIGLKYIEKELQDKELQKYVSELRTDVSQLLTEIKGYSYYLRPKSLDELGLCPTLSYFTEQMQQQFPHWNISFTYNEERRMSEEIEINLYRVVQEAVFNSLKYANGSTLSIDLQYQKEFIVLSVQDDGIGIDLQKKGDGLGIKHMKERLALVEGTFSIFSEKGKGTTIRGTVPRNEAMKYEDESINC